jgi:hypothetical protein
MDTSHSNPRIRSTTTSMLKTTSRPCARADLRATPRYASQKSPTKEVHLTQKRPNTDTHAQLLNDEYVSIADSKDAFLHMRRTQYEIAMFVCEDDRCACCACCACCLRFVALALCLCLTVSVGSVSINVNVPVPVSASLCLSVCLLVCLPVCLPLLPLLDQHA